MMETLTYTVIKTVEQYHEYCNLVERYVREDEEGWKEHIALLEVLIDRWDDTHAVFDYADPIQLLQALMAEHQLKQTELAAQVGISEGYLSEILSYKKGISKKIIQQLARIFSVRQELFNRTYPLRKDSPEKRKKPVVPYQEHPGASAYPDVFNQQMPVLNDSAELEYRRPAKKTAKKQPNEKKNR